MSVPASDSERLELGAKGANGHEDLGHRDLVTQPPVNACSSFAAPKIDVRGLSRRISPDSQSPHLIR
jgi:hypothetical protein